MPNVLDHRDAVGAIEGGDRRAADIAAYLATLTDPRLEDASRPAKSPSAPAAETRKGERLFSSIGCSACHVACDSSGSKSSGSNEDHPIVSLSLVGEKWKPRALRAFLRAPDRHYRWTRMPDFRLSLVEAEQLTAYLLNGLPGNELKRLPTGDAANGLQLVATLGCLGCREAYRYARRWNICHYRNSGIYSRRIR